MSEPKRGIGAVTVSSSAGAGAGYAAAKVVVWLLAQFGVDATPIEDALGLIITLAGGVIGGWLVKPGGGRRVSTD